MHRKRIDAGDVTPAAKYSAYYGSINVRAKLGDMAGAESAYAEFLELPLDNAARKQVKHRLVDYRASKKHGGYPLVLTPTSRQSRGSFGSSPVGECRLTGR